VIVVDTSALMAILLAEPESARCINVLQGHAQVYMSAGTLAEAMVVAGRRNIADELAALVDGLGIEVAPLSSAGAARVAQAYRRWGKGVHSAGLNLGDCFAYALADELGAPLLYVGHDFAATDLTAAQP